MRTFENIQNSTNLSANTKTNKGYGCYCLSEVTAVFSYLSYSFFCFFGCGVSCRGAFSLASLFSGVLGTDMPRREVEIERKLTEHIQNFLLELGQGFAFVGRQVHLEVGGDDFYIDLLFYHLKLRCYVVIELKACDFEPGFISQLNMYQNVVNDILRHPNDNPTIGLLLVKGKNQTVVEYSLAGYQNPIGVAEWKNQMVKSLPEELKSSLPSIEEIEKELE